MHQTILRIHTRPRAIHDVTRDVAREVAESGVTTGLATALILHTSASLLLQENADPAVLRDFQRFFAKLVPERGFDYEHSAEGPDDMPAHIRAALTHSQLSIPITAGALVLGTWQGIYVWEHRAHPHTRQIALHIQGE